MSRPIVVIVCMGSSSEPWEPYQRPHPWHSRAGGGAVHSINSGHHASGLPLPKSADTVAKVENRTAPKISRKLILDFLAAATRCSAVTKVHGRFWLKRCGPSRRRVRTASAVFKIFLLHPKKTFAT